MKNIHINEDNLPQKLPVSFSTKIRNNINLIKDYNQNNLEALYQWNDYIDTLTSYISNRKIAWDYANRYTHFPNGAIHIKELGFDVAFIVKTNNTTHTNYVYVFKLNLKPQEFGLKIPPILKENKIQNSYNSMKNKKVIRLTETDLHRIISKTVKSVLQEGKRDFDKYPRLKRAYSVLESAMYAFEDAIQYSDVDLQEEPNMKEVLDHLYCAKTIIQDKFMTYHPSATETMYGD